MEAPPPESLIASHRFELCISSCCRMSGPCLTFFGVTTAAHVSGCMLCSSLVTTTTYFATFWQMIQSTIRDVAGGAGYTLVGLHVNAVHDNVGRAPPMGLHHGSLHCLLLARSAE